MNETTIDPFDRVIESITFANDYFFLTQLLYSLGTEDDTKFIFGTMPTPSDWAAFTDHRRAIGFHGQAFYLYLTEGILTINYVPSDKEIEQAGSEKKAQAAMGSELHEKLKHGIETSAYPLGLELEWKGGGTAFRLHRTDVDDID